MWGLVNNGRFIELVAEPREVTVYRTIDHRRESVRYETMEEPGPRGAVVRRQVPVPHIDIETIREAVVIGVEAFDDIDALAEHGILPISDVLRDYPEASEALMAHLRAAIAAERWRRQVGGVEVAGRMVDTTAGSRSEISLRRSAADRDPANWNKIWKFADGSTGAIDAATIVAMDDAVTAHIDRCFEIEADLLARLDTGEALTQNEIAAAFAA